MIVMMVAVAVVILAGYVALFVLIAKYKVRICELEQQIIYLRLCIEGLEDDLEDLDTVTEQRLAALGYKVE